MEELITIFDNQLIDARTIPGSGSLFSTEMWLDGRDITYLYGKGKSTSFPMTISLNEYGNYFSSSASAIKLEQGMHTTLRIKVVETVATTHFKEEHLSTRQCRFPHENPGLKSHGFFISF